MAGRTFTTTISVDGKIQASVQKAFDAVSDKLDAVQKAALETAGATSKLTAVIDTQKDGLEAAKKAYTDYILGEEKSKKKAKELAKNIQKLAKELEDNEENLSNAQEAAERLAGGLKKTGDSAEDAKDGFTVMKGAAAQLVANGITKVAEACVNVVKNIYGLAESTREYREDMGKLETAFEAAGKSTDLATETYKNFYSVLGEEDRSVEAVNHLAKFVETEQDMQKWTDICAGVWGTFGDSLPIEGLTEAANETAKVGEVTGVLADALNWAGVNQDDFQNYLDKCTTEQERAAYITEMLNSLYGDAADKYKENNASIIKARKANSNYTDTVAKLGKIIEPITTKVQEGFTLILQKVLDLVSGGDIEAFGDRIDDAFASFVDNVLPKIISAMDWISNNTGLLTGIAVAIGVVAAAIGVMNAVLAVQNAIMLASPVTWIVLGIVAAIAALIAIIVLCVEHWDEIKAAALSAVEWIVGAWNSVATWMNETVIQPIANFFSNMWSGISSAASSAVAWITSTWTTVSTWVNDKVVQPIANFFTNLWTGINNGIDGMVSFFTNAFSSLAGIVKAPINAVVSIINGAVNAINSVGFTIPDWVPIIGGKRFSVNIPKLPTFATGGFTEGVSIAGEDPRYPVEAVISFNPAYRAENLAYWAEAGRKLGVDAIDISGIPMYATGGFTDGISIAGEKATEAIISFDPAYRTENMSIWARSGRMLGVDTQDLSLGTASTESYIDFGGVTFAPNITVSGNADKESIMEAIEAEYPEFIDMLEEYLTQRSVTAYA